MEKRRNFLRKYGTKQKRERKLEEWKVERMES